MGLSGSKEGIELALQPPVVKAEELIAPRDMGLWRVQLQLLKHLDDCIEAGRVERLDGDGSLRNSPSIMMMKSRLLKRTCVPGT